MSVHTRDEIMFAISLLAAASSACLYVVAVRYRVWGAVWSFGATLLVFGIAAVVLFARLLWEGGVGAEAWNVLALVLALMFGAGSFYYYVAGVVEGRRPLSRLSALAFLVCCAAAVLMVVRILRGAA